MITEQKQKTISRRFLCSLFFFFPLHLRYLEQGSLFDHLHKKNTKLSEDMMLNICEDIALGMTYLHGRKILHCDLKSSNILIDSNWNICLLYTSPSPRDGLLSRMPSSA
eukprot:TRINITY_DN4927_c0_g1_i2.p1 TRINITY_DN4927_c0_g1~~TRINITY_DN4927_c0_g1_i2.p1  ORF type:complete len:109 (+),score=21.08 TRINITY_DN4927_c0_g1_i2:21-347(+)